MATMKNVEASESWRESYRAALFEKDKQKLPSRIDEAESALVIRGRQLFASLGDNDQEVEAVDDALYALRALRNCLQLKTIESDAA